MLMIDVLIFFPHLFKFKCSVGGSVLKSTLKFGKMQYQKILLHFSVEPLSAPSHGLPHTAGL